MEAWSRARRRQPARARAGCREPPSPAAQERGWQPLWNVGELRAAHPLIDAAELKVEAGKVLELLHALLLNAEQMI